MIQSTLKYRTANVEMLVQTGIIVEESRRIVIPVYKGFTVMVIECIIITVIRWCCIIPLSIAIVLAQKCFMRLID